MDGFLLYLRNSGNFLDNNTILLLVKRRDMCVVMLRAKTLQLNEVE